MAIYHVPPGGGAPQRLGLAPFHNMRFVDFAANGRRGVVATRPLVSDLWLIRNFGVLAQR